MAAYKYQSMYGHFSDGISPSKPFIKGLHELTRYDASFTNKDAYKVYAQFCSKKPNAWTGSILNGVPVTSNETWRYDEWLQMNARNQLCKLEHWGFLKRVHPGVYVWHPRYGAMHITSLLRDVHILQCYALENRARIKARVKVLEAQGLSTEAIYKMLDRERDGGNRYER